MPKPSYIQAANPSLSRINKKLKENAQNINGQQADLPQQLPQVEQRVAQQQAAYQQVVSKPANQNWYKGSAPTTREFLGQMVRIQKTDPAAAAAFAGQFSSLQNDSSSQYFWPYKNATNRAIMGLGGTGFDVSGGITSDWVQKNSGLQNYYQFGDVTNTPQKPSKPGKKATQDQINAYNQAMSGYYYYQIANDEQQTVNAETEWDAMQHELAYWAGRNDLNMSDDEIVEKVRGEMKTKYPTLYKMDQSILPGGSVMSFNRAIGYSPDNMYGAIWASRNNGGTGNAEADTALGAAGEGNQWQENALVRNARTSAPYTVGMVGLNDEGLLFNRSRFDQRWLDENSSMIYSDDQSIQRAYAHVAEAEEFTQAAESELAAMHQEIDSRLPYYADNPEALIDFIYGGNDYSHLQAMDRGAKTGNFKATTRAVEYSREGIEDYIRKQCAMQKEKAPTQQAVRNAVSLLGGKVANALQAPQEDTENPGDNNLAQAGPVIRDHGNSYEQSAFAYGGDQVQQSAEVLAGTQIESDDQLDNAVAASISSMFPRMHQELSEDSAVIGSYTDLQNDLSTKRDRLNTLRNLLSVLGGDLTDRQLAVVEEYTTEREQLEDEIPALESRVAGAESGYNDATARQLASAGVYGYFNTLLPEGMRQSFEDTFVNNRQPTAPEQTDAKDQIDAIVRESGQPTEQDQLDQMTASVITGQIDYGAWLQVGSGNAHEFTTIRNVRDISRNMDALRREGKLNGYGDVALMNAEGLDQHQQAWEDRLAAAEELAEQLRGITRGRDSTGVLTGLNERVHNERTIIEGEGYSARDKRVAGETLSGLLAKDRYGFNKIEGNVSILRGYLEQNPDADPAERRARAYDIMNGDGSYEAKVAGLNEQERAEFDGWIDGVLFEAWDCVNALEACESEARYARRQLDQNSDQRRWNGEYIELMEKYGGALQRGDGSFIEENVRWDPSMDDVYSGIVAGRVADRVYAIANGKAYGLDKKWNDTNSGTRAVTQGDRNAVLMTEEELGIFNALYNAGEYDEAEAFYAGLQVALNQRGHYFEEINWREKSAQLPILSSLATLAATGLQPLEFLCNIVNMGAYYLGMSDVDPGDAFSEMTYLTRYKNVARSQITENLGDIGRYLYAPMMSGADSWLNMVLAGGAGAATQLGTLALFSTQSFQSSYQGYLAQSKGNVGWAVWGATVDTLIEDFTEIASLEALMSDPRNIALYLLKNAGAEGSEEFVGALFGPYIKAIAGRENEWEVRADEIWNAGEYINENGERVKVKSRLEAGKIAAKEWWSDIMESTLSGAISTGGGIFRAAGYGIQGHQAERVRVHDLAVLEGMRGSSPNVVSGITGIMYNGIGDMNASQASAQSLMDICGGNQETAVSLVQGLSVATRGNENLYMKNALGYASLTNGTAREVLDGMVDTLRNGGQITNENANALAEAVAADREGENHEELQQQYDHAVRETRIANKVNAAARAGQFANVALANAEAAEQRRNQRIAEENALNAQDRVNAVSDNLATVEQNYDPAVSETAGPLEQTTNELEGAIRNRDQANQQAYQAKHSAQNAQKKADNAATEAMYQARHGARAEVVQEDATAAVQSADQAAAEASQLLGTDQQTEGDSENAASVPAYSNPKLESLNQKLVNARQQLDQAQQANDGSDQAMTAVEEATDALNAATREIGEELGLIRREGESVADWSARTAADRVVALPKYKNLSEEDRQRLWDKTYNIKQSQYSSKSALKRKDFVDNISQKFGLDVKVAKDTKEFVDIGGGEGKVNKKANAYFMPGTNKIVINPNASVSDVMYAVLTHELTHVAELSETYSELADAVLQMKYGDGASFNDTLSAMANGDSSSVLAQDILQKISGYGKEGVKLDNEGALHEIVSDAMGDILLGEGNNQELINQLANNPSVARRIIDAIKSFLKKVAGIETPATTRAQQVVDMLEQKLKEAVPKIERSMPATEQRDLKNSINTSYMDAVENGDTELAKQLVREYARAQGFDVDALAYHGTNAFGFTQFDMGASQDAIFVAYSPELAATYSRNAKLKDIKDMNRSDKANLVRQAMATAGDELSDLIMTAQQMGINIPVDNAFGYRIKSLSYNGDGNFTVNLEGRPGTTLEPQTRTISQAYLQTAIANTLTDFFGDEANAGGIYTFYTRPGNQLVVDAKGANWNEITPDWDEKYEQYGVTMKTRDIAEYARNHGYDSVRINNVHDSGQYGTSREQGYGDIGIFFNQQDVKSADTFTKYDDNSVVPLNERFTDSPDIRYSLAEDEAIDTDEDGNVLASEFPGGTVSVNPDVIFSLNSFNEDEQAAVRQSLLDSGRFTPEQVDHYMENALSIASMIAADRVRLDFNVTDDKKSMVKSNSDYGASIDASTLCAKRLVYQGTFDAIQHLLPNTPLMPEDLIRLSDMMREMGYETPCGICYVESRRRNLDSYIAEWLQNFKGTEHDDFIPQIADVSTTDGLEVVRKNHPETYRAFMDAMNSHGKQNNPKPVQLRTEYKGEIRNLSDRLREKFINHGGIRLQSFSDFETPHLLDMMQVVMDISSKGLTSQAYTKVPNFAWVFGDTGVKINLSLIGKGEGVDADGNLIFDDVEGMPFEEAMKLRNRYSKNVGTILVGINDRQILAAMADPRIDYIIPFHSSGWTKNDMRLMPTLSSYTDYQNYQTEKDVDTGAKTKKNGGNNIAPVGAKDSYGNGYWDFNRSGKENAETYLDLCFKNGLVPVFSQFLDKDSSGHYRLKADGSTDGYWKLLIDFKMYENGGDGSQGVVKGAPQMPVTPNINMDQATRVMNEYSLERVQPGSKTDLKTPAATMKDNNSLPVAQPVVDRFVQEYKEKHPLNESRLQYSLPSEDQTGQELSPQQQEYFRNSKAVDENGRLKRLFHGTKIGGFTGFRNTEDYGYFFTDNEDVSATYSGTNYKYSPVKANSWDDVIANAKGLGYKLKLEDDGLYHVNMNPFAFESEDKTYTPDQLQEANDDIIASSGNGSNYEVYLNLTNPLVVDGGGDHWSSVSDHSGNHSGIAMKTRDWVRKAIDEGYDGVIFKNIIDEGTNRGVVDPDQTRTSNVYVAVNPEQIKSVNNTEPTSHKDIRYSMDDETARQTQEEIDRWFDDFVSGLSTEELDDLAQEMYGISLNAAPKEEEPVQEDAQEEELSGDLHELYMNAVNSGDTETARKIIDKIAKAAGYTVYGTHRTNGDFTVFERNSETGKRGATLGDGFYIASGEGTEYDNDHYGKKRMLVYAKPGKTLDIQKRGLTKQQANKVYDKYFAPHHSDAANEEDSPYRLHVIEKLRNGFRVMDYIKEAAEKNNTTTDVVLKGLGYNSVKDGPQYCVFDSSQIKLADPITYDDKGNVIPSSERINKKNPDIRYSLPTDAPYMAAVERGEMDDAANMIIEAAQKANYTDTVYHGTRKFGFTEFDMGLGMDTIFVAYNKNVAQTYADDADIKEIGKGRKFYYNMFNEELERELKADKRAKYNGSPIKDVQYMTQSQLRDFVNSAISTAMSKLDGMSWDDTATSREALINSASDDTGVSREEAESCNSPMELAQLLSEKLENSRYPNDRNKTALLYLLRVGGRNMDTDGKDVFSVLNDFEGFTWFAYDPDYDSGAFKVENEEGLVGVKSPGGVASMLDEDNRAGVYEMFARPGKQLVVDADGAYWNKIPFEPLWNEAASKLSSYQLMNGEEPNNAFMTREIAEWAKRNGYDSVRINNVNDSGSWGRDGYGDVGIFFNPQDVKSADTVTYDDNGNIIPPSERFNTENNDIRYSLPSDDYLGQVAEEDIASLAGAEQDHTETGPTDQRQWGSERAQMSNELHQQVKDYLYEHSEYTPDTNADQIDRAIDWLMARPGKTVNDRFYGAMQEATGENFNSMSADGQARMLTLMSYAASTNNVAAETELATAYNEQGTRAGQTLQARKIFRLMTPLGRQSLILKIQERINDQYKMEDSDVRVSLSPLVIQAAGNANTEQEFHEVQKAANKDLARQMPPDWKGKMRTWRMMSMLLNPRTHIRNIVGNALFVPVVGMKNVIGTGLERASESTNKGLFGIKGLKVGNGQRTKSISLNNDAVEFARNDYESMIDVVSGEVKYGADTQLDRERKYFGQKDTILSKTLGKAVQKAADKNSDWLEKQDKYFSRGHYIRSLAGWMTANNVTEADMKKNPHMLQTAREYAVKEAQKATYRDTNEVASALNKLGQREDAIGFVVNAAIPFKKTPANILRRGVEYSPVGLAQTILTAKRSLEKYAIWEKNGFKGPMPKGAKSATEVIDRMSAGMTGTMVSAMGALLKAIGAVTLKLGDKPDDELEKLEGKQEYSLTLFGHNITLDWAAPVCMPFFFGASAMSWYDEVSNGEASLTSLLDSLLGMTEPVFNLSMLDGINSLLRTSSYSSGNVPLGEIGLKLLTNYASSYVPSALGAAARTIDTTRRRTYTESGSGMIWGKVNAMLEQMQNKIPYLSMENSPYRNSIGEPDVTDRWMAVLENFILPGYINKVEPTVITEELGRIYDQTGDAGVIPKSVSGTKTIKVDGETIRLTDQQNDAYQEAYGTAVRDTLTTMFGMPEFAALSDVNPDAQAALVGDVMTYAKAAAKYALFPDASPATGWVRGALESDNPAEYIIQRAEAEAREHSATEFRSGAATSIQNGDYDTTMTCVAGMKAAGWSDAKIRDKIMDDVGPVYKHAYMAGDTDTVEAIEKILPLLDLEKPFTKSTFDAWRRNAGAGGED